MRLGNKVKSLVHRVSRKPLVKLITHPSFPNFLIPSINLKIIRYIGINSCGMVDGKIPYIELNDGLKFFGKLPSSHDRKLFRKHFNQLPKELTEDSFRVALDISQRFCMENGYFMNLPRSYYMKPGGTVLDIGSYIGFGAMRASRTVGARGVVCAVEMDPENYELLQMNVHENKLKNITPLNCAVNDKDQIINFYKGKNQANSIYQDVIRNIDTVETQIQSITIDSIISNLDIDVKTCPVFASLEINGAEPEALIGASKLLNTAQDLHMRIAAPYTVSGEECRVKIVNTLRQYPDINVYDVPPQVVVSKIV